jgi:hypothetical protein
MPCLAAAKHCRKFFLRKMRKLDSLVHSVLVQIEDADAAISQLGKGLHRS